MPPCNKVMSIHVYISSINPTFAHLTFDVNSGLSVALGNIFRVNMRFENELFVVLFRIHSNFFEIQNFAPYNFFLVVNQLPG